jgi:hypothetical protein
MSFGAWRLCLLPTAVALTLAGCAPRKRLGTGDHPETAASRTRYQAPGAVGPTPAARVTGTVLDLESYEPLAGRTVAFWGRTTLTDASGTFVLEDVPPVYDTTIVEPDGTTATLYRGLRRRNPILMHRKMKRYPVGTFHAELHGRLTGGGPYPLEGDTASIYFFSPSPGVSTRLFLAPPYPNGRGPDWTIPMWSTSDSISGTVYAMRENRVAPVHTSRPDASTAGAPVRWSFGQQAVTMHSGQTTSAEITLAPASSLRFSVRLKSPPEHDPFLATKYLVALGGTDFMGPLGGCARRAGTRRFAPDVWWDCEVAALPTAEATLCVWDAGGSGAALGTTRCHVEDGDALSMVLQSAPSWTEPADLAAWSDGMRFAWTAFDQGVYRLELSVQMPAPQTPSVDVYTSDTAATWPDLSALGVALPKASAEYRVHVVGLGPYASMDEATGSEGIGAFAPKESRASVSKERRVIVMPEHVDAGPTCEFPDTIALVCDRSQWPNETYVLAAINNTLRHYPAFASAIGISCVKDCTSARAFGKAYEEYSRQHPGFDANQPIDEPLAPPCP